MKQLFVPKNFRKASVELIEQANDIIEEYASQGYELTLRQLYYQFVSRALIPNTQKSYKNLGNVVSDGRLAGLIDWDAIVDRTRNLKDNPHWENAADYIMPDGFAVNKWLKQEYRPEVWIEKEALIGVIEPVCQRLDVPCFACKGYNSQSEQWKAGQRFAYYLSEGQIPIVLHLGDHDPSGIDMTRDNEFRLSQFAWNHVEVRRLALNMDQVEKYDPPPNYAKATDSRYADYAALYGDDSWELDALEPRVIEDLVDTAVSELCDQELWDEAAAYEDTVKNRFYEIQEQLTEEGL